MKITRMDLDGTGSPAGLVSRILKIETALKTPVPIEELAFQFDIEKIAPLETEGFEGGLLTDEARSTGIILVNKAAFSGRRRFTIGHELGHFLLISHSPVEQGKFLCSRADMATWSSDQNDRYARMEAEANDFSALLLMPPPVLRKMIEAKKNPDLSHIPELALHFDVSKEAAARAYARFHHANVAIVIVKDGIVRRIHKSLNFPWINVAYGKPVPTGSVFYRKNLFERSASDIIESFPGNWIDAKFGQKAPDLFEQVYLQKNGFALMLLWAEISDPDDEEDPDENRTSKERFQDRQSRWRS